MKRFDLFAFLFLLLLCAACGKQESRLDAFDEEVVITDYERVFSDKEQPLGLIVNMSIVDGMLITGHASDDYAYSFIDSDRKELVCRWGKRGEGPREFAGISSSFAVADGKLFFMESARKEIKAATIAGILKDGDSVRVESTPYPYIRDFRPFRFTVVDDKRVFLGAFGEGRFGMTNADGQIVSTVSDYPFDCGGAEGIYRGTTLQGDIMVCGKQGKFAISTFCSDVFEIYSVEGDNVQRMYVSPYHNPPQLLKKGGQFAVDIDKSIGGLLKMAVSEEFIYFTYSSQSYRDALRADKVSKEILCFDWEGKKVKKYILPIPVRTFCVDKQYIYGVCNYEEEAVVYRFKL